MKALGLEPRWLASDLDDPDEAATLAELDIVVEGERLGQVEDRSTARLWTGTHVPTLPLAQGLAEGWWRLLHEPEKRRDRRAEARHRLDVLVTGYLFPPLALWSAGEGVVARLLTPDTRFHPHLLLHLPDRTEPWHLPRAAVERSLLDLIRVTLDRLPRGAGLELREVWGRLEASMADDAERPWCIAAGRLGFDPYDPATPDLDALAGSLSPTLFAELSDAATAEDLPAARDWIEAHRPGLENGTEIELDDLGACPPGEPDDHPAHVGYAAADRLRAVLGIRPVPSGVLASLFGYPRAIGADAPHAVQGLGRRGDRALRAAVVARDAPELHFRLLRAAYLGWQSRPGEEFLVTPARTRRHQAAGAFAAEILAPKELLLERAGDRRPTGEDVAAWAAEWGTTPHVVAEQLRNRLQVTPRMVS